MAKIDFLTPIGRLVKGSVYKGSTTDAEGKPLVVKSGANKGQPRTEFYFALAIQKQPGHTHFAQTDWGQKLYALGAQMFPNAYQSPAFAWKVKDGDSTVPNKRGKVPAQQAGHPGHWVLSFSSGYAPKLHDGRQNPTNPPPLTQDGAINLGDYVQVFGSIDGNGSDNQPGMFLNHSMVCLFGHGERIVVGPDAASVGFGQGVQLPPGASLMPVGGMAPAVAAGVAGVVAPLAQPQYVAPPVVTAPQQFAPPAGVAPVAPVAVAPNAAFLQPPAAVAPAVPMAPPAAPPAAPVRQMTAKAGGASYEQFIGSGWNDQQLIQQGYMTA
jgi:hypothetical protein